MLGSTSYCPTLHTRLAELKAFGKLPNQTKDKVLPLLLGRPWPKANHIETTWEKIGEAIGQRRFALDLDRNQLGVDNGRPASKAFQRLFDRDTGFKNYYEAVQRLPFAIPVLRQMGGRIESLEDQARYVDGIDRGVAVRLEFGVSESPADLIDAVLKRFKDVLFFVDSGWSRDLLNREVWASGIIERISRTYPETEIVVSGSSFPDSFVNAGKRRAVRVDERVLHQNLVRRHNAARLIYGDWGSTRPPSPPVPMKNVPRIDLPMRSEWISFRRDQSLSVEEDYQDIARRIIEDQSWSTDLNIWGTYAIGWTANGEPGAIRGSATAAAARINIHLHRQAFFDENDVIVDGDEPFTDD